MDGSFSHIRTTKTVTVDYEVTIEYEVQGFHEENLT